MDKDTQDKLDNLLKRATWLVEELENLLKILGRKSLADIKKEVEVAQMLAETVTGPAARYEYRARKAETEAQERIAKWQVMAQVLPATIPFLKGMKPEEVQSIIKMMAPTVDGE